MKNAFKFGFGLVLGSELAKLVVCIVNRIIVDKAANNESYMNKQKEEDPEMYETLKQYSKD